MRYAYLILAHGSFELLRKTLAFLDSENADFYIHVDAKAVFDESLLTQAVKKSRLTFIPRRRISWGHSSITEAELDLLRAAAARGYDYYHLLSGVDLPIKSRSYIEHYFEKVPAGTNFIQLEEEKICREHHDRVKYFYPFQRFNIQNRALRLIIRRICVLLQKPFIDRTRKDPEGYVFQKGAQWFSITDALVREILSKENWLRKRYQSTFCSDEIFLQSLVINSPFRHTLPSAYCGPDTGNALRYIDWKRGKPYTFGPDDFDELVQAGEPYLFARKFREEDSAFTDRLLSHFSEDTKAQPSGT